MRTAFFSTLADVAASDPSIYLLVGDLGFGAVEPFAKQFAERFVNVGVAEQNLVGIAAGLALSGKTVFTYSIGNFPTLRCLEQIRNDVCYHRASVTIVAVGGGFAYGPLGMSHHTTEDLAIMRSLPEMVVVAPGDPVEVGGATRALAAHRGPAYLRLGRAGEPVLHQHAIDFRLGHAIEMRPGCDLTLISTGGMLEATLRVARKLAGDGLDPRVLSMPTVNPLDVGAVLDAARETRAIFTIEEHSVVGGLGSAVAEVLAEIPERPLFKRVGIPSTFAYVAGSQEHLKHLFGLSDAAIVEQIQSVFRDVDSIADRLPCI
jgi:transketolase